MGSVPRVWRGIEKEEVYAIVMPFMANGDLYSKMSLNKQLPELICQFLAKRLLGTFRYLTNKNILHRDIKAENILLDDNFQPILIDFGFSCETTSHCKDFVGDIR